MASTCYRHDRAKSLDADVLHALIIKRADELAGCIEGSEEERELEAIADALRSGALTRWQDRRRQGLEQHLTPVRYRKKRHLRCGVWRCLSVTRPGAGFG